MAGIYLHIPLCRQKCAYCDFYSVVNSKINDDFVAALAKEIELQKSYLQGETIQSIYFGGGTPSLLSYQNLEYLLNTVHKGYRLQKDMEITLEANPDDLSMEYLTGIQKAGVNRLSIGIQSFQEAGLKQMRRRHTALQAGESVNNAKAAGFKNISIDLIYGLPELDMKKWVENINKAIDLKVQHISAYGLSIEPNTLFHKLYKGNKLILPSDDESINQYSELIDRLEDEGYVHYEISNFAKDGHISLHNTNYWLDVKYLGLGPSAHSYDLTSRQWNIRDIRAYIHGIFQGKLLYEKEILTLQEKYNDYVIVSLRTMWGLNEKKLKKSFGDTFHQYFVQQAQKYIETEYIKKENGSFIFTRKGLFISDRIIESCLFI